MPLDVTFSSSPPKQAACSAASLQRHRALLDEAIELTAHRMRLAQRLEEARIEAELARLAADPDSPPGLTPEQELKAAQAHECRFRSLRQGIMLARRLAEPGAGSDAAEQRRAARRSIRRTLEDEIQREWVGDTAESLREEVIDRLDSPEIEEEIGTRPTHEILDEIRRDLPLGAPPGAKRPWCRRTPEEVGDLHAWSAQPPAAEARAAKQRAVWPQGGRANPALPEDPGEAIAALLAGELRR